MPCIFLQVLYSTIGSGSVYASLVLIINMGLGAV